MQWCKFKEDRRIKIVTIDFRFKLFYHIRTKFIIACKFYRVTLVVADLKILVKENLHDVKCLGQNTIKSVTISQLSDERNFPNNTDKVVE